MSKPGFKQEPEKGCDATHRASFLVTHTGRALAGEDSAISVGGDARALSAAR